MKFRKLRFAWSIVCGVLCVLLIALWVRSYWWYDCVVHYGQPGCLSISLSSGPDGIELGTTYYTPFPFGEPSGTYWKFWSSAIELDDGASMTPFVLYFNTGGGRDILVPFWLPTLICAALAPLTWIRRFSLRTVLIAMTLVAALLSFIVYAFGN